MRKIVVTKKTGYRINDPTKAVIIRDARGIIFFTTEAQLPRVRFFNMPPFGVFYVEQGDFSELPEPIKYRYHNMPAPQRNRRSPFGFEVVFVDKNPAKCTIDWDKEKIYVDKTFKEKPLYWLFFLLYHEFAHAKYGADPWSLPETKKQAERNCDLMAGNYMKARGFNPNQILLASTQALSDHDPLRKVQLKDALESVN